MQGPSTVVADTVYTMSFSGDIKRYSVSKAPAVNAYFVKDPQGVLHAYPDLQSLAISVRIFIGAEFVRLYHGKACIFKSPSRSD